MGAPLSPTACLVFALAFASQALGVGYLQRGPDIDGDDAFDNSGQSVAVSLDGSVVAVSASGNDGGGTGAGQVRVFVYDGVSESWIQRGTDIYGEAAGDGSGRSIALNSDGTVVAIGALGNEGNGTFSGHARVYAYDSGSMDWVQRGGDIDGEAAQDFCGESVALSSDGTVVAVSAQFNDGGGTDSGHVRVFDYDSGSMNWVQRGSDIDGEAANDQSGDSVSLSADGNIVAIGASQNDGNGGESGHARVYAYDSGSMDWVQRGSDIDGESGDDLAGASVSLSADGDLIAIGAPLNDGNGTNAGHARVYAYDSGSMDWVQRGSDIDGEDSFNNLGRSVSLSSDGGVLAAGAPLNDGNGSTSGHVRVFEYDSGSGSWEQRGVDIDGEAAEDESGSSVALSSGGDVLVVAALKNDDNGLSSGHARIFGAAYDKAELAAERVLGQMDVTTDPGAFGLFDADDLALERILGQTDVESDPGAFGLFDSDDLAAERVLGQGDVTADPGAFGLFDSDDIAAERVLGQMDVTGDPAAYSLFDSDDIAAERILGQTDVVNDPGSYGLFDSDDIAAERTAGQLDVTSSPGTYSLFTQTELDNEKTIVNVSARVVVGAGEVIIPGFVVLGEDKEILVRAVGPKLADLGVGSPLADPTMTLFKTRFDGELPDVIATVDDWREDGADVAALNAAMTAVGAFPLEPTEDFQGQALPTDDTKSAVALVTLVSGVYTVVVASADGGEGEVLVEAYEKTE